MNNYSLWLFHREAQNSGTYMRDITWHARGWTRSIHAMGGFWTGDFTITSETMSRLGLFDFYNSCLGFRLVENTYSITSWEGEIVEMTLTVNGDQETRSLDIEKCHNNVIVDYGHDMTASSEVTESSDIFGEIQYIDNVDSTYDSTAAAAIRDRRLTENAYPRSKPSGGLVSGAPTDSGPDTLHVIVAGYCLSMNRLYQTTDVAAANLSAQISTLVGNSEFVTAGSIETNTLQVPIRAAGNYPRLWDAIEQIIEMGDASGNRYVGGVYAGLEFNYEAAETEVTHYWRNQILFSKAGQREFPTLIKPNIIVQKGQGPFPPIMLNAGVWDRVQNIYIEAVEFTAPNQFRLIPYGGA